MSRNQNKEKTVIPTEASPSPREEEAQWRDLLLFPWRVTLRAAVAFLALGVATSALPQKAGSANVTADLPPGPMHSKATTACLECHEARIILQQRLSQAGWTKEVDKMMKWGAVVDPTDRDALIDYLSANFGPDKPAYQPQRTAGKSSSGK